MNLILCSEPCCHQKDGYCRLEGNAKITNALASPCCYFQSTDENNKKKENKSL